MNTFELNSSSNNIEIFFKEFLFRLGMWWVNLRKPFAAAVGVTIGGICALVSAERNVVAIDPSSVVFVTVLLVDMSSAEAFYITATFRILGTLIGLLAGAGVSFITNAIVSSGETGWGLYAFQLSCMAIFVFFAFFIEVHYPKYAYVSVIFVYTASALVYSGTSNAVTLATIAAVIGGCIIATSVMWIFNYEPAEMTLLKNHQSLVTQILDMIKWSVRANPRYREDFFKILDDTRNAFDTNADFIGNYLRWMKWMRQKPEFDFVALTKALRPLYNQTAAFFWALCRDKLIGSSAEEYLDAKYLYCLTSEQYFDFFHGFVTELVEAVDSMQRKLSKIFRQHPNRLLGKIKRMKSKVLGEKAQRAKSEEEEVDPELLIHSILRDDVVVILRSIIRMKHRYGSQKLIVHPNFPQQWFFSDYTYQITLILFDLLEYLRTAIDTVVADTRKRQRLQRHLRALAIRTEAIGNGGFLQAKSFDEAAENLDEEALRMIMDSLEDDVDSLPPSDQEDV
jgi:hypothetical protein